MEEELLKGKSLLVVDDENDLRDIISSELEFMGANVFQAENITNAQNILSKNKIDLIVSDIRMPGGTGIDLLNNIKKRDSTEPPVILITGFADITTEDAYDKGAEALVNKPFKLDDLIKMIARYTSPPDQRFHEPEAGLRKLDPDVSANNFFLGRGGFSSSFKLEGRKLDAGELINFDFVYEGKKLSGVGACRWQRPSDHSPKETFVGVEFMKLNDECLKGLEHTILDKSFVPYIPAIKH